MREVRREKRSVCMKLGIVGTNFISEWLAQASKYVKDIELYAVYSRSEETAAQFANKYDIKKTYQDYAAFLEDEKLDIVYIASPNFLHASQAIQAMEAGKHVLVEKVIATNLKELKQMMEASQKNNVVLLEAMRPDFDPAYELIKAKLTQIGTVRRVCFDYCQYSSRYDRFKNGEILNAFNPELSNAAIMDIGVYCIHTFVRLFGKPTAVQSYSTFLHNKMEGSGSILLHYPDMIGEIRYSKITSSTQSSFIQGEDATITIDELSAPHKMEIQYRDGTKEEIFYEAPENNMKFELEKMVELVREKQIHHPYLDYSLQTLTIIGEARRQNGIVFPADEN